MSRHVNIACIIHACDRIKHIKPVLQFRFEPVHEKTNNLHMRKQRRRSVVQ